MKQCYNHLTGSCFRSQNRDKNRNRKQPPTLYFGENLKIQSTYLQYIMRGSILFRTSTIYPIPCHGRAAADSCPQKSRNYRPNFCGDAGLLRRSFLCLILNSLSPFYCFCQGEASVAAQFPGLKPVRTVNFPMADRMPAERTFAKLKQTKNP